MKIDRPSLTEEDKPRKVHREEHKEAARVLTVVGSDIEAEVAKMLKLSTFEPEHHYWLDTGSEDLNAVLGSPSYGIPYGKIVELAGEEELGKTTITMYIAGLAQKDGAAIGRIDLERAADRKWDLKMGLDPDSITNVYPKLIMPSDKKKQGESDDEAEEVVAPRKKKKKKLVVPRLQTAEELFEEAEMGMHILAKRGYKKQFWYLDSIAFIQTEMVVEAGVNGQNMRTKLDRATFLSQQLPRFAGLAANYNVTLFLINQLRDKQGMVFGDPTFSPGGRGLRHACSVRARIRRAKGGVAVLKMGKKIGMRGAIVNIKNKAGEGSERAATCLYKIITSKTPARVVFLPLE